MKKFYKKYDNVKNDCILSTKTTIYQYFTFTLTVYIVDYIMDNTVVMQRDSLVLRWDTAGIRLLIKI